jgi:DnaJ-class molecular chaperone
MSNEDHYETLNVPRSASQRDIAKAYRALMRTHHPDLDTRTGVDPAELLSIMKAFAVLRDPAARAAYDHSFTGEAKPVPGAKRAAQAKPATQGKSASQATRAAEAAPAAEAKPSAQAAPDAQAARVKKEPSPQDVPVRHIHTDEPLFRVSPVLWESGPWAGRHNTPQGRPSHE